jgi:hypothetical protein
MQRRGAFLRKGAREALAGFLDPKAIPSSMAVLAQWRTTASPSVANSTWTTGTKSYYPLRLRSIQQYSDSYKGSCGMCATSPSRLSQKLKFHLSTFCYRRGGFLLPVPRTVDSATHDLCTDTNQRRRLLRISLYVHRAPIEIQNFTSSGRTLHL